jgi:hypothetical protein
MFNGFSLFYFFKKYKVEMSTNIMIMKYVLMWLHDNFSLCLFRLKMDFCVQDETSRIKAKW